MPYTKNELQQELLRCYEENCHITSNILNDPNTDYPTQMTYSNHFGTLTDAKESVGIYGGHTRERVIKDIQKCNEQHGTVKLSLLNNDSKLINQSTLYEHFDSLSSAIESSDITVDKTNEKPKYSKEELLDMLSSCKEEMGDTKTTTVNEYKGCPSSQTYITADFKNSNRVQEIIDSLDAFAESADAHVYVLKLDVNNETAYYVGESTNLHKRLQSHIYEQKIQTWANSSHGKILAPREKTNVVNDVSVNGVEFVIPLYRKDNESDIEFRRRRKYREHHIHLQVAMDKQTLDVYGGR